LTIKEPNPNMDHGFNEISPISKAYKDIRYNKIRYLS
jgi:hypothetical protein